MTLLDNRALEPMPGEAGLSALRAAGVAGLVFAILSTVTLLLLRETPPIDRAAFPAWWETYEQRHAIGLFLVPFAGIAFLWLLAVMRRRIGRGEDQFYATVFIGSGLLYVAMYFAAAAVTGGTATTPDTPEDLAYESFMLGRAMARTFYFAFAIKMAAAFMLVSSTIIRRTSVLPNWFAVAGMVGGIVLLLTITVFEPIALVFSAWVAMLSLLLLRARPDSWSGSS